MKRLYGLLRSLVIYHVRPGRLHRATEHYRPFVDPDDLVFDIGAHVGNRTRAFARLGARVVAVEPQPHVARFLRRLFRRTPRVTVDQRAVGLSDGTTELFIAPTNPTITSTSEEWVSTAQRLPEWNRYAFSQTETVETVTIDTLIATYGTPRFIKIDIEGSEADALAGLSNPVENVSFEFLPADRDVAFHAIIRLERIAADAGCRVEYNFSLGEEMRLVMPDRWWSAAELQEYLDEIPKDGPSGDIYARIVRDAAPR